MEPKIDCHPHKKTNVTYCGSKIPLNIISMTSNHYNVYVFFHHTRLLCIYQVIMQIRQRQYNQNLSLKMYHQKRSLDLDTEIKL